MNDTISANAWSDLHPQDSFPVFKLQDLEPSQNKYDLTQMMTPVRGRRIRVSADDKGTSMHLINHINCGYRISKNG